MYYAYVFSILFLLCQKNTTIYSESVSLPVLMRSSVPTKRKQWNSILIVMVEIREKRRNSKRSMKHTQFSQIHKRNPIMIDSDQQNECEDSAEDFSEDLMPGISVIFFHHFLVGDSAVDRDASEISEKISRYVYGYRSRMRSSEPIER